MRRSLLLAYFLVPGILFALLFDATGLSASDNYSVAYAASENITAHGTCAKVRNDSASNASVYVPTQTAVEWQSFRDHPPAGVTVGPCCDGVLVGGYCWYIGELGQSCTQVCANHDGYNIATKDYAGSSGTNANCASVQDALGVKYTAMSNYCSNTCSTGCIVHIGGNRHRNTNSATTEGSKYSRYRRICACNN